MIPSPRDPEAAARLVVVADIDLGSMLTEDVG